MFFAYNFFSGNNFKAIKFGIRINSAFFDTPILKISRKIIFSHIGNFVQVLNAYAQ